MTDFSYDVFLSHNSRKKPRVFDEWNVRSGHLIMDSL